MSEGNSPASTYSVNSEVGKLRKVLVCAPGLAHQRLTPTNCDDLLFDDVMWVQNAPAGPLRLHGQDAGARRRGRRAAQPARRDAGVPEARAWLLDRKIVAERGRPRSGRDDPGVPRRPAARASWPRYLIGGLRPPTCRTSFRPGYISLARESPGAREYLMPPLPNTLYTRDTTCWIYGGVTLNPLYWPARHDETLLMKAIYRFHPDFVGATVWWGDPELDWRLATLEGGDVMPIGNGVVLIGMSERSSRQAITQVAAALFAAGRRGAGDRRRNAEAARRHAPGHGLHVRRPRLRDGLSRASSTASTRSRCARATGTSAVEVSEESRPSSRSSAYALGLDELRVIETGGDVYDTERQQWDSGNNLVAIEPGVVVGVRPQHHHKLPAAQGRHRGDHHRRRRAGPRPGRWPLHDLPAYPRRRRLLKRFRPFELTLCALIIVGAVIGVISLATGAITI